MRKHIQVVRGGALVESERYLDFTVITDPAPDSSLMQASRLRAYITLLIRWKPTG